MRQKRAKSIHTDVHGADRWEGEQTAGKALRGGKGRSNTHTTGTLKGKRERTGRSSVQRDDAEMKDIKLQIQETPVPQAGPVQKHN